MKMSEWKHRIKVQKKYNKSIFSIELRKKILHIWTYSYISTLVIDHSITACFLFNLFLKIGIALMNTQIY